MQRDAEFRCTHNYGIKSSLLPPSEAVKSSVATILHVTAFETVSGALSFTIPNVVCLIADIMSRLLVAVEVRTCGSSAPAPHQQLLLLLLPSDTLAYISDISLKLHS